MCSMRHAPYSHNSLIGCGVASGDSKRKTDFCIAFGRLNLRAIVLLP